MHPGVESGHSEALVHWTHTLPMQKGVESVTDAPKHCASLLHWTQSLPAEQYGVPASSGAHSESSVHSEQIPEAQ
jgi:hypothetical protein